MLSLILLQIAEAAGNAALAKFGAGIGAAIAVIGAAYGIGNIGRAAMEAIARQPESSSDLRAGMILSAALVEGVALFAILVCILILVLK